MTAKVDTNYSQLFEFITKVCRVMPEYRRFDSRIYYPVGLLILSIFLSECAGCSTQMNKVIWLKKTFIGFLNFGVGAAVQLNLGVLHPNQQSVEWKMG